MLRGVSGTKRSTDQIGSVYFFCGGVSLAPVCGTSSYLAHLTRSLEFRCPFFDFGWLSSVRMLQASYEDLLASGQLMTLRTGWRALRWRLSCSNQSCPSRVEDETHFRCEGVCSEVRSLEQSRSVSQPYDSLEIGQRLHLFEKQWCNWLSRKDRVFACLGVLATTVLICSRAIQPEGRDWASKYARAFSTSQLNCSSDSKTKPLNDNVQKIKVSQSCFCNFCHRPCLPSSSSLFDNFLILILIRRTGKTPLSRTSWAVDSSFLCTATCVTRLQALPYTLSKIASSTFWDWKILLLISSNLSQIPCDMARNRIRTWNWSVRPHRPLHGWAVTRATLKSLGGDGCLANCRPSDFEANSAMQDWGQSRVPKAWSGKLPIICILSHFLAPNCQAIRGGYRLALV